MVTATAHSHSQETSWSQLGAQHLGAVQALKAMVEILTGADEGLDRQVTCHGTPVSRA